MSSLSPVALKNPALAQRINYVDKFGMVSTRQKKNRFITGLSPCTYFFLIVTIKWR